MKNSLLILIVLGVLGIVSLGYIFTNSPNDTQQTNTTVIREIIPVDSITHGHGLAIDVEDPNSLYIATHHGLLVLKNDKELFSLGSQKDDYMGFSRHPSDPTVFYSSGHPTEGGNIGFQKSTDGGHSWEKISDGVNGPVDFHAMTVSPVNPKLIYGWYQGALQRSEDEGKTWQIASTTQFPVINLAADPKDVNVLFAASPLGLYKSTDKGKSWEQMQEGFVSAIAVNPVNAKNLISFSENNKLAISNDGGNSWEKKDEAFSNETPLYIAISNQQPEIVYILTEKNSIYKSKDSTNSWSKIR